MDKQSLPNFDPKLLDYKLTASIKEAARLLSVSSLLAQRLAYNGKLRSVKLGRRRLIPFIELEKLIKNHME